MVKKHTPYRRKIPPPPVREQAGEPPIAVIAWPERHELAAISRLIYDADWDELSADLKLTVLTHWEALRVQ